MEMKRTEKKHDLKPPGNTDKLVFVTKVFSPSKKVAVSISKESCAIVNDICLRTGLTASEIVNRMIAFCEPKVEILPGFYYTEEDESEE